MSWKTGIRSAFGLQLHMRIFRRSKKPFFASIPPLPQNACQYHAFECRGLCDTNGIVAARQRHKSTRPRDPPVYRSRDVRLIRDLSLPNVIKLASGRRQQPTNKRKRRASVFSTYIFEPGYNSTLFHRGIRNPYGTGQQAGTSASQNSVQKTIPRHQAEDEDYFLLR
jgi:hypothetical protein